MLTFGPYLRALRVAREWNQTELGRRVGLSQSHVAKIERDEKRPRPETIEQLAKVLNPPDLPRFVRLAVIASAPKKWHRFFEGVV